MAQEQTVRLRVGALAGSCGHDNEMQRIPWLSGQLWSSCTCRVALGACYADKLLLSVGPHCRPNERRVLHCKYNSCLEQNINILTTKVIGWLGLCDHQQMKYCRTINLTCRFHLKSLLTPCSRNFENNQPNLMVDVRNYLFPTSYNCDV
jgi:hypothetical protein